MQNKKVKCSAPGKVIVFGEHSVVYNKKAIAGAIDSRITVEACGHHGKNEFSVFFDENTSLVFSMENIVKLRIKILGNSKDSARIIKKFVEENLPSASKFHQKAVVLLLFAYSRTFDHCKVNFNCIEIKVSSELPTGCGLGSSAAYSVALSAVFLTFFKAFDLDSTGNLDANSLKIVNELAYEMEKLSHGNPSGVDNTVATFGGVLIYKSGSYHFLSQPPQFNMLVVNSCISRDTKKIVEKVRICYEQYPVIIEPVLNSMDQISNMAEECFNTLALEGIDEATKYDQFTKIKDLMCMNHHLLNCIGTGHDALTKIYQTSSSHQLSCKITGAGGGGCCIIMLHGISNDEIDKLKSDLTKVLDGKVELFNVKFGCKGVKIEDYHEE